MKNLIANYNRDFHSIKLIYQKLFSLLAFHRFNLMMMSNFIYIKY